VTLSTSLAGFRRDDRQFMLFARLAPGASLRDASQELSNISSRLATDQPATNKDWATYPVALTRMHGRDSRGAFILLQGAVGFVLLIACANIANILLARASTRRHEMAVRVALGASRSHLVRGLLTESVLLSVAGGAAGVMLSMWGIRLARALGGFPEVIDPSLNVMVLAFTAALSMLTGILCGIVPALRASNVAPEPVLRRGSGRGVPGPGRGRLRSALVAAQVAGALVLATCGGLMLRSLANRERVNVGFDTRNALRADVSLPVDRYRNPEALRAAAGNIFDHLHREPDVVAAGASTWALPTSAGAQRELTLPAERDTALERSVRRGVEAVTPGYFAALGAPMTLGRGFTDADRAGTAPIAIVNEELVRHLWPSRNPVAELLRLGSVDENAPVVTVVGVVSTIRRSRMHDVPVARVYVPYAQYPNFALSIVVRARTDIGAASRALQNAIRRTDASLLVEGMRSVDADLAQFVAPIRLMTSLLGAFGVVGLLLAGLGVFGTMSYTVSQREREMAVRAALGAARGDIVRLVFGSALRITAAGVFVGMLIAIAATRTLSSFLFGVTPNDPATLATVISFLTIVALVSCYRPARVAATADPMAILRQ
jgi:putative ABC transport system permease protein